MHTPSPFEVPRVQLVEIRLVAEFTTQQQVHEPRDIGRMLHDLIGNADREHFVAVYLDARHRVTHVHTVSVGHLTATTVHPREVFKGALLANAQALVVGHNHPSGDVNPSTEDRRVVERLREAGTVLGIELLDAVIVGPGRRFYSFASECTSSL